MAKKLHLEDDSRPSFKQIVQGLKSQLDMKGIESSPLDDMDVDDPDQEWSGGLLTLSYGEFCGIAGRTQLRKRLYTEVELEASRIGLIVAFGWNTVIVATDSHFAPDGWSTWDAANQPRPPHSVLRAPERPKWSNPELQDLMHKKASS